MGNQEVPGIENRPTVAHVVDGKGEVTCYPCASLMHTHAALLCMQHLTVSSHVASK
ncbi:MAG: hypothetical protein AVDCRST_MAG93-4761 [uncultured Chloroflexia bacterium]|uniref:Uncharacterized protein n=1 Tax=uncultured Chloroflexia bacterium TaxID=1672391 RepID=A0A6J4KEC9_9CHLR|nr:MAG: hypothetical protein AVDCRST_MAG93-4761 [uncultured Chloroflexia bacterium]